MAYSDEIDYWTVSTLGNATDFGDLSSARNGVGCESDGTKGVWCGGGGTYVTTIEYVNIASLGNTTSFGDLPVARWVAQACGDGTTMLVAGGHS